MGECQIGRFQPFLEPFCPIWLSSFAIDCDRSAGSGREAQRPASHGRQLAAPGRTDRRPGSSENDDCHPRAGSAQPIADQPPRTRIKYPEIFIRITENCENNNHTNHQICTLYCRNLLNEPKSSLCNDPPGTTPGRIGPVQAAFTQTGVKPVDIDLKVRNLTI